MSLCNLASDCPFYQSDTEIQTIMGDDFRKVFCEDRWQECARYQMSCRGVFDDTPVNTYPNMTFKDGVRMFFTNYF